MFIFLLLFFIVMLENPAPFSLNFSSPMTYSSNERSSHIAPSPQPHPLTKTIPLKTSVLFPIAITLCKHWSKFVICSPDPRDCGGVSMVFDYVKQNEYLKISDPLTLGKMSVGGKKYPRHAEMEEKRLIFK